MLKRIMCTLSICLACMFFVQNDFVRAVDDESYYGDGCTATWNDISGYLSAIYRNTPYISVSNGTTVQKFYFNVELFMDMGLYIYGDPFSVQFSSTVNDFKAADYGYFRTESQGKTVKGEYRYLGYSIDGIPITNSRFPSEMETNMGEMVLMKYTDLPEDLQETYNVKGFTNASYESIRHLIEAPDSPIWDFVNMTDGVEVSLRERLTSFGLMKDGVPSVNILDYGILYSWAESGGVLRIFYHSKEDSDAIRYSTFSGPVSININKKWPQFKAELSLPENQDRMIGENTFYVDSDVQTLSVRIDMKSVFTDNYSGLSNFEKMYAYTRDDLEQFTFIIENYQLNNTVPYYYENDIETFGYLSNYDIPVSNLIPGRNIINIVASASAQLDSYTVIATASIDIIVIYEDTSTSTSASSTAEIAPTAEAIVTPAVTPAITPSIIVSRKW